MRSKDFRRAACCASLLALLWSASAFSQFTQFSRFPLPSDEHTGLAAAADAAMAAGEFDEAVQQMQKLLDLPEDSIDPSNLRSSLKAGVQERLLSAPAAGLEAYEQRFGPQARALLNDALRDHDLMRLSELVRRYFGTLAGQAGSVVLAQRLADDGDALSAARLYDRLAAHPRSTRDDRADWMLRAAACWRLAGFEQTARERINARAGESPPEAGNEPAWPAEAQAWFSERSDGDTSSPSAAAQSTSTFRGDPQRNAGFAPAVPVGPVVWEYPAVDEWDFLDPSRAQPIASRLEELKRQYEADDAKRALIPAGLPVAGAGLAVFRGPGTIKAVSLETGELAWSGVHVDDTFHHLVDREWARREEDWHGVNLDLMLVQRMYRDATFSSLSTDGRYVYALADGGMMSSVSQSAAALPALIDHQLAPHSFNRLLVFELSSGRLVREYGGPTTTAPLSGAYFLGAPLALDGQLFCLLESQGQVQLVVLDQQTHDILWRQALYNPATNFSDPMGGMDRRLAGIVPAADGDIVVCPTGETTVVGIDRRRRTIEWTYEYQRPATHSPRNVMQMRMMMARRQMRGRIEEQLTRELLSPNHWQDAAPIISGKHVLVTPPDSKDLVCLHLVDGRELWRRPRGDRQWIATVHAGIVVLVGKDQVEAVRLADGEPAWESPVSIAPPGGRGFRHGRRYLLPLATGEAASIDIASGRMTARTKLPASIGRCNLVAADGRVVCQTADSLLAFRPVDELTADAEERLAARSDDASALLLRGELRLHLGDEAAALDNLRRALRIEPDSPARRLLASTLTEGLRTDFDAYRSAAPEIERLAESVSDQARFHRLYAGGLQRNGEIDAAFAQYLRFVDKTAGVKGLQDIDGMRQVRSDLWVAGRLQELLDVAENTARGDLETELARAVSQALASGDAPRLNALRHVVGDSAEQLRIDWHFLDNHQMSAVQTESLLLRVSRTDDDAQAGQATARLADRWLAAGRASELLDRLLSELGGRLSDVDCQDGRTGAELLSEWRSDPQRAALIEAVNPWPTADVVAEERTRGLPSHQFPVHQLGPQSRLLGGWSFYTDREGAHLHAFDQFGTQVWRVPSGIDNKLSRRRSPNYVRYVATYDRFVLLVGEDRWTLLDALPAEGSPQVLGSERLYAGSDGPAMMPSIPRGNQPRRNRNRAWTDSRTGLAPLGNVGPIVNGMFVYQRGHRLAAVSVVTGEELWTHERPDLAAGSDIVSDSRTVVIWPHDAEELQLFRPVDGSFLGTAKLPPFARKPQPEGYWGARLVTFQRRVDGKRFDLGMFDPVTQSHVWQRSLSNIRDWGVVEGRDFYVLQTDGTLRVINADDGQDRMRVAVPEGETAELVTFWSDADRWYAATYRTADGKRATIGSARQQVFDVHGVVLAVSKQTGGLQWSVPVPNQQWHRGLPGKWPFLMLSTGVVAPSRESPKRSWSLLLLEKSTGRVLLETTVAGRSEQHGWLSEPERHRIHLATGSIKTTLEFSDPSAEPPAEDDPE